MNSRVATSQKSDVGIASVRAGAEGEEVAVRPETEENSHAKPARQKKQSGGKGAGKDGSGDVGQMLRGAYSQTVDEAIPDDLMDLLNRLE